MNFKNYKYDEFFETVSRVVYFDQCFHRNVT